MGAGKKKQKIVEGVNVTDNDIDDPVNIDGVDGLKGGASEKANFESLMVRVLRLMSGCLVVWMYVCLVVY